MSRFKKVFATVSVVALLGVAAVPAPASAVTAAELQAQIDALLAQIQSLQAQLAEVEGTSPGTITGIPSGHVWNSNLTVGSTGNDVKYLQILLNSDSATKLADSGAGSPGSETTFFGPITRGGVIKFQEKYTADVLTPVGLTAGTGFFGPSTRSKANSILGAAVVPPPPAPDPDEPAVDTPTEQAPVVSLSGNKLDIRLAADTPAGTTIADAANANFTKLILTAGDEDVTISKIDVLRQGLTANADLENVKVLDVNGVNKGSVASFNVNNKAGVTFTPNLKITKNTSSTFFLRAGIVDGTAANKTVALGIDKAADVVSSADEVMLSSTPLAGSTFNTVTLTIGTVEVTEDGSLADSSPNVGDNDVVVNKFRVIAGSGEAITLHQITAQEVGNASLSDTANIELYDVTNGKSLGTVANWDGAGNASWSNLNIKIAKGVTHRFKIQLDIVDGPGLTINADIMDGSDVLMDVTGDTYGFFITPDGNDASDWSNSNDGRGANDQTIQTGSLVVTKSPSTPATGNIAPANDQVLAGWDFVVLGEEMRVTAMALDFDRSGITCAEITSVRIFDQDDNIVAGPLDCASDAVSFTDTFIVPIGTITYFAKANISTATSDGDTVDVGVNTPATMTVRGMTSNDTITPTPSTEVEGNTQTVNAAALAATTLTEPVARNVAPGITDFIWATFSLDAAGSGEDVQVTEVQIQNNPTTSSSSEIQNAEIWADLTSANSSRGDKFETKITNTIQFDTTTASTDEDETFTFTQTVTIPKDQFVHFALVADLSTAVTASDTFQLNLDTDSGDVTATGADTGQTVTLTPTGPGQTMTVVAAGTLTVSADASQADAKLMIGGPTDEDETLAVLRFAADTVEDIELDDVLFQVTNGTRVSSYKFYVGSTQVATATGGNTPRPFFDDGEAVVPAGQNLKLTVKADLADIVPTSSTDTTNQDVSITVNMDNIADVNATGLDSGSAATISGTMSANTHIVFEAYPKFSVNSASPSGDLTTLSSAALVAIFDVTAVGGEDIYFDSTDIITFDVSQSMTDSDGTANTYTLKDQAGNTLDTATVADENSSNAAFNFGTATFTVPAGGTKQLYVYADTREMEDNGDTVQVWLDDGSATNDFEWEIDNDGGQYEHPDIIFRGDIFANSLVNPT